jgi:hypothetical protein
LSQQAKKRESLPEREGCGARLFWLAFLEPVEKITLYHQPGNGVEMTIMGTTELLFIGVAVVAVLAIVAYVVVRSRRPREEAIYHFRCPGCKRRLRYRERQVGHKGTCSNCGQHLSFPPISESID